MRTVPPTEKGKYRAIASGAIANGKPVVVNSDGTVSLPNPDSVGSAAVFQSVNPTNYINMAFDSSNNKVIIAYGNGSNNDGLVVVGTVSGTSISYGTPVTIESNVIEPNVVFDSDSNKVVILYRRGGVGKAKVGTVSGTSISLGSEAQWAAQPTNYPQGATFDSNSNKVVIGYRDAANGNYGTAVVGTVSGTDISFGTATVFESAGSKNISLSFDSTNNKVVITYTDQDNSNYGTGIVGTVSGTGISFGSATAFTSSAVANYMANAYDPDQQKTIVAYANSGSSNVGEARVGTVSGTSISFGDAINFDTPASGNAASYVGIAYDPSNDKIVIVNSNGGFSVVTGTVSGNSITFGSDFIIDTDTGGAHSIVVFDSSNNKLVVAHNDSGNSYYGTAYVLTLGNGITFTTENYIGIANSCSFHGNTETITVTVAGGIFYLDGVANPVIQLLKGHTYIFDQADNTNDGHPLHFKDSGGSQYTTGVTVTGTAGTSGAKVTIAIASDATEPTRYYCTVHGNGMGNTINLSDSFVNVDVIGTVNDQQSSLTAGQQYFVQNDGTLSETADSPSVFAGTAISATELVVEE